MHLWSTQREHLEITQKSLTSLAERTSSAGPAPTFLYVLFLFVFIMVMLHQQIDDRFFRNAMSSPPPRDPGGPEAGPSKPRLEPGSSTVARLETAGPSSARLEQPGPSMTRLESGAGPSNTRPSSRPSVHPPSSSGRSFSSMLSY